LKKLFFIWTCLFTVSPVLGQNPNQIIITVIEQTDWTFNKKDELFLQTTVKKNQIIYNLDTINQQYTTYNYLIENYFNIWDGDTIVKEKLKTKYKKWSNIVDSVQSVDLVNSLTTDIDTLEKDMSMLHTSHHYLTIHIDIVSGNDTINYNKTKPFKHLTPWFSDKSDIVLNPNIDKQIFLMLPEKFIGREKLGQ
jgi:hypothetical protein